MIKQRHYSGLFLWIPGMIAQAIGFMVLERQPEDSSQVLLALLLVLGGTVLAIAGFALYAKAKGQSALWGCAGVMGMLGLILVARLRDESGDPWGT
jgi:hypothetical protein